ncbi:hypothetical protein [uncultured Jannaschia sp.]|uniref:hypothetical protein n=1 Tax=uncultured Jannaschia sp. TaxID=293347 RepID=UPI0026256611|nr:hypothetical protein [uncultured Jannaschia sp.]
MTPAPPGLPSEARPSPRRLGPGPKGAIAVALLVVAVAIALVATAPRSAALHLSGDGVAEVAARLADLPRADIPDAALVEAVLLRRPGNIRHLPDLARVCRGRCAGQAVTALIRLSPGGTRKTVVIDLERLGAGAALDQGGALLPDAADCAADVIRAEMAALRADPPDCAGTRRVVFVLPWGL